MPEPPDQATIDAQPHSGMDELASLRAELAQVRADLAQANRALAASRTEAGGLNAELQHRVRNILSVVRSIFSRTVDNADTLEHVADHFQGRIDALARYQLRDASSRGYDLEEMIHDTFITYAVLDDPRVTITGPEVRLSGRTAETVGVVLHELATNAVKFGMLSNADGRGTLAIDWSTARGMLLFEWNESGIAILSSAPLRTGFGRDYIEQGLPYQLGGEASLELAAGRLRCALAIPLSDQQNLNQGGLDQENRLRREQIPPKGVNDL